MAVRVLIVDDVSQVRQDLRTLLTLAGDIEVVGEAADGMQAINLVEMLQPDVVLTDLEMPVLDGFEAARAIKAICPACRVVALTIHGGDEERRRAYLAGVDVFVVKGAPVEELIDGIHGRLPDKQNTQGGPK